jgi:hypothetical protein
VFAIPKKANLSTFGRPTLVVGMSALGQKQTFALHQAMSALLPKADIKCYRANARYRPIADDLRLSPIGSRQDDLENGAAWSSPRSNEPTSMTFDNHAANGQSQSHPVRLRRYKGIEYVF